jgi:hypothetical protein
MHRTKEGTMSGFKIDAGREWIASWKRRTCDHPNCSRWLTVGYLKSRSVGVQMGASWYCSYGCFHSAAQEEITQLLGVRLSPYSSKPRMSLGLTLVGRGQLTAEQLRFTSEQMLGGNLDAGDLFVENGFVTEAQVAAARAAIWGCPVYNPTPAIINTGIHIPPVLASSCLVVPMHYVPATRQLLLGFLRSVDYELMFAVENMIGCTAKACFVKPSDFHLHEAHTHLKQPEAAEAPSGMTFNTSYSNSERARILCNYGAGVDANHVKITLCKNYLWARLQGGAGTCDLLFKVD